MDKAIESEILAVESDEEEVPPLPPSLIHPALNTYHSNSVAATIVGWAGVLPLRPWQYVILL